MQKIIDVRSCSDHVSLKDENNKLRANGNDKNKTISIKSR